MHYQSTTLQFLSPTQFWERQLHILTVAGVLAPHFIALKLFISVPMHYLFLAQHSGGTVFPMELRISHLFPNHALAVPDSFSETGRKSFALRKIRLRCTVAILDPNFLYFTIAAQPGASTRNALFNPHKSTIFNSMMSALRVKQMWPHFIPHVE